ncbi:LuxR C-terminal-related transcriptional regulator [Dactylosporangium sp. CA-092794]|uniref:LuxR C-terminal-related transcriptional regulator n=1 Tax=Dactylosporangium sp. CA-092794 TaxID=3239929 RepID=UPI003D94A949
MQGPLVATKLLIPAIRQSVVARPRLRERLVRGAAARLTLVSAPAGFGKTTLLSAWPGAAGAAERAVAWVSLDEGDSRPATFWAYVIAALQRAVPGVGAGALALLESAQPPIEGLLATVVNELSAVDGDVDLVLDDYHLVDNGDIHAGLGYLLEHLPPRVHLVISTRADPPLPLARLRARGELVELRAADLRFTSAEAATYLSEVAGLRLSPADVAALEERTEGWIAALQLAALSLQGRADVTGFIAGFAGDDRYIVDYLVEEVLSRQPEHVRGFLLQTSVLDRLSGPLCDAVTGESGGKARLEALDRANLFTVRLDDNRRWYRYHRLFADVLHARLLDERPEQVAGLHRRASQWYDRHGEPSAGVRHALAAGDVEHAAGLMELAVPALRRTRQEATIRGWIGAVPDDVVRARPVLAAALAGALLAGGQLDGVEGRLAGAERSLAAPGGIVVQDREGLARLPGTIALYRAGLALGLGDVPAALGQAQLAVDRAGDDHMTRAAAAGLRGLAFWGGGDLEAAHRAYSACVDGLLRAGHIPDVLGCSITLADLRITQGRLGEAAETYESALRLAAREAGTVVRGTADMRVGLSQIACERDDLAAAAGHLRRSDELGEHTGMPQHPYRRRVALAGLRQAQGDPDGALELLDEAQRVYVGDFAPDVRPIAALRARLLAAHGRTGEALRWARDRGLSAGDDLSYAREFEHITLAAVLLSGPAADGHEAALGLLHRLETAAEEGGRAGNLIEVLILRARALQARGDTAAALVPLERALSLAEPEGYVRVFVDGGPAVATLLSTVAKRRESAQYPRQLMNATGKTSRGRIPDAGQRLVDPLSERELGVLRLLASDLDGPGIARRLGISVNTLRTHTRNIYAKLGVNSRRAAVRQAGRLDLL